MLFPYLNKLTIPQQVDKSRQLADRIYAVALELSEIMECLSNATLTEEEKDAVHENVVPMLDVIELVEIYLNHT